MARGPNVMTPVPVFAMSAAARSPRRQAQELGRLDLQHGRKLLDNLEACIEGAALLKLAEIAPAHVGLIGEVVLRQPLRMAQATEIEGEHFPQVDVHAGKGKHLLKMRTPIYLTKWMGAPVPARKFTHLS